MFINLCHSRTFFTLAIGLSGLTFTTECNKRWRKVSLRMVFFNCLYLISSFFLEPLYFGFKHRTCWYNHVSIVDLKPAPSIIDEFSNWTLNMTVVVTLSPFSPQILIILTIFIDSSQQNHRPNIYHSWQIFDKRVAVLFNRSQGSWPGVPPTKWNLRKQDCHALIKLHSISTQYTLSSGVVFLLCSKGGRVTCKVLIVIYVKGHEYLFVDQDANEDTHCRIHVLKLGLGFKISIFSEFGYEATAKNTWMFDN